jgi:kumamolisin
VGYQAARTHPSLPRRFGGAVLGINGLQPYLHARKHLVFKPQANSSDAPPYHIGDILNAYNAASVTTSGNNQTIAILIDSFPKNSDLTTFWTNNGIAQSLSNITEINVANASLPSPSGEETLDVEWSSGIAPNAMIRVYAASSLAFANLDQAIEQIITDLPSQPNLHQLSISLGLGETYVGASQMTTDAQYFATIASAGVSIFVSSGDAGSDPNSSGSSGGPTQVEYYSSDPSVAGVGGTTLNLNSSTDALVSETAWSGSGGGASIQFSRPSWQTAPGMAGGTARLVPDVCAAADPNTGAYVYLNGSVQQIGGTSWATPTWAGFCALINEGRATASQTPLGLMGPRLYPLAGTSNFRDITSGSNG